MTEDNSYYWNVARKFKIKETLQTLIGGLDWIVLQGEITGEGIQGNKYPMDGGERFWAFNLISPEEKLTTEEMQRTLLHYGIYTVPIFDDKFVIPEEWEISDLVHYVQGKSQIYPRVKRKVETISASMATMAFNNFYTDILKERVRRELGECQTEADKKKVTDYYAKYARKCGRAMFDSRAWNMPEFEVINEFIWRQNDCVRNSIQSVAQANFSAKQLEHKNRKELMDMLMLKKGVNWNDYPIHLKRGSCCIKVTHVYNEGTPDEFTRNKWVIDKEIPTFTKDRDYIEKRFKSIRTVTNKVDQK